MKPLEFDKTEKLILQGLKRGMTTKEISEWLQKKKHKPNSIATIDNRLSSLKMKLRAKNLFQLGYRAKRKELI